MLILARGDLERLLAPGDVITAVEGAFARYAAGGCTIPPRTAVRVTEQDLLLLMPGVSRGAEGGPPAVGTKLVSVYPGNRARGHPTLHASYLLLDGATGGPLALMEGTFLTGIRTGATSALAARFLARPDACRVTCFGAGVQAAFQLLCLAAVRRIERVTVVGRGPARARAFVETIQATLGLPVALASDGHAATRDADIVTCATTSVTPVVFGADLRPGTHVDAVGAFRPTDREVDTAAVRRARIVVDTYAGALEEAGDVLIPLREGAIERGHIAAELAELVTGARPGRSRGDEITLFKSVGFALEDLATASLAYARARERGLGVEASL